LGFRLSSVELHKDPGIMSLVLTSLLFAASVLCEVWCAALPESRTCTTAAPETVLLQIDHTADLHTVKIPSVLPGMELRPDGMEESTDSEAGLVQEADYVLRLAPTQNEREHFDLVKAERARGWTCPDGTVFPPNSGEFKWDCRLWKAALKWSQRMVTEDFIAHRKDGSTSCTRTEAEGFPKGRGCGENIAGGGSTPQAAIELLKKSNDHCRNMFEPKFNKLGVGFASNSASQFKFYWTDSFGDWHQGPDQSCIGGYPAPSPAPGCADIDTFNCPTYKAQGYCAYSPNVQAQCKETCNIDGCGSSAPARPNPRPAAPRVPAPSPSSTCADIDGACEYYGKEGFCATSDHIRKQCRKTCRVCGSCSDIDGACDYYKKHGFCASSDHIRKNCKKTCGVC